MKLLLMEIIASNKSAKRDYEIIETYEAGISLLGPEVKSARERKVNLKDSFARVENGEIFVYNIHISPYAYSNLTEEDAKRKRKLLLHRREIDKLIGKVKERGFTLVPLKLYFKKHLVKLELALVRGKKLYDKRETIRRREQELQMRRIMKAKGSQ
ncbi:MAG: SsrA-binding protein SmpB [Candidatus Omnitrophica bacterium]|nr:SsrA-binding protein SmpB [Candidatus Omnitrophota bacterium]